MAEQTKEIEKQLKQMLWSSNMENNHSEEKKKPSKGNFGERHRYSKKNRQKVTSGANSSTSGKIDIESDTGRSGANAPRRILQRKDAKNTKSEQNKTASLEISLGPKEDIGQPIGRGEKSRILPSKTAKGEKKVDLDSTEKKSLVKKKMKKKSKTKKKSENDETSDPHANKITRPEEESKSVPITIFIYEEECSATS